MVLFNRLWQGSLADEAAEVLAHLEARGWTRREAGLRARIVIEGEENGERVRITWKGGVLGSRCRVKVGRASWTTEHIRTPEDFARALSPPSASSADITPA